MRKYIYIALLPLAACASKSTESTTTTTTETVTVPTMASANAELASKSGSKAQGTVQFSETTTGLKVDYKITGLKKNGKHGFHVHETGDCSSPDAKSAGKHYMQVAPTGGTAADSPAKHAGDLPQLQADAQGVAEGSFEVTGLSVDKTNPVANRAIIVHGGPDNPKMKSPPRIACGVITSGVKVN